ncbi:hypothetical protein [Paenibacillus sp. NPDC057934]|uniref:hypothetical protein n=1 Tax=Paenibacillus sp. NPDC057934 TaxID=3346282 RepID=UPI0036DD4459
MKDEIFSVKGKNLIQTPKGVKLENFITNPGNSIWRYADGRRWQINDYKENKGYNESYNVDATDNTMPSGAPPTRKVSTKTNPVDPSAATWFKTNETDIVPSSNIVQSSIQLNPLSLVGDVGSIGIKDGKFIISYSLPSQNFEMEEVSDRFDKGIWVEGRLYYITLPYYFTATAKLTSYSYSGNVTFDYTLPTEPTLTGSATIIKPNPNPALYEGKDVPATLSLKGDLAAYTNTSNISEWIFYAKEKGADSTLQIKKEYSKVLSANKEFSFTIPKAKMTNKDKFEQPYSLTVVVRFTKPVETKAGTITSLEKTFTPVVEVSITPIMPTPPPSGGGGQPSKLLPPVAVLDTPDEVMAGEDFMADGRDSYDKDGTIVDYKWTTPNAMSPVAGPYGYTWYDLNQVGITQRVSLRVIDNDGLANSTSRQIKVIKPIPEASLEIGGTKKENRKVIIKDASTSPYYYPIDPAKTRFSLEAVSGGTNEDIKYSGTLSGFNEKDVLFKKPGKYKATISVTNTAGFSDSTSVSFDIVPDQPPVAYFSAPSKVYRSPDQGNRAIVSLSDLSFSTDWDFIGHRKWEYRYDSNNNGSFDDETWRVFSDENKAVLNLELLEVGKYEIRLTVTEEFDQPTIPEFVTAADRRSADSYTSKPPQSVTERIVNVMNRAPEVDWSW